LKIVSFFQAMLIYDPAARMTAKEILQHAYFDNLDKSALPASKFKDQFVAFTPNPALRPAN
jgi:serine/threonine protein kinase